MKSLGKDIGQLVLRRHLDEPHLAVLDDLLGEVLPELLETGLSGDQC